MSDGFREINLEDTEQGVVKLLVAVPREDEPWGVLAPLRGTSWGDQVAIVSGESLSHALHGWATPLMREIGPEPRHRAKRVPKLCVLLKGCAGAGPGCKPGVDVPACYEPPEAPPGASWVVTRMVLAWREGRYVVVVDGPEFSLI